MWYILVSVLGLFLALLLFVGRLFRGKVLVNKPSKGFEMQSGELVVTGNDYALIYLSGLPAQVKAKFKDKCHIVPCAPHHHDDLQWSVFNDIKAGFVLKIMWNVSDVREIAWEVSY